MSLAAITTLAENFTALSAEKRLELLKACERLLELQNAKEKPADLDHQQASK